LNSAIGAHCLIEGGEGCVDARQKWPIKNHLRASHPATAATSSELSKLKHQGASVTLDLPGNPNLVAEGILTLNDAFPPQQYFSKQISISFLTTWCTP